MIAEQLCMTAEDVLSQLSPGSPGPLISADSLLYMNDMHAPLLCSKGLPTWLVVRTEDAQR